MGILSRFSDIVAANINDLLGKAENPAKMVNQYLIDARRDLAEVKEEAAKVIAEETDAKRDLDENAKQVEKYKGLAKQALEAGNEADAKVFISKKQKLESNGTTLELAYGAAHANADKMRQLYNKLSGDIAILEEKRDAIESKVAIAKTQETVNKFSDSSEHFTRTASAFERMEEKADRMLDAANAKAALDAVPVDEAAALEEKYAAGDTASVEDELAALKAELEK